MFAAFTDGFCLKLSVAKRIRQRVSQHGSLPACMLSLVTVPRAGLHMPVHASMVCQLMLCLLVCCTRQLWCKYRFQKDKEPQPRRPSYAPDLNGPDGADKAARFLSWYIEEGHPGLLVSTMLDDHNHT